MSKRNRQFFTNLCGLRRALDNIDDNAPHPEPITFKTREEKLAKQAAKRARRAARYAK